MGRSESPTTLQRPYLLRAMHEWMTDNDLTPHIVIDVAAAPPDLPLEHAKDGRLVINVSYSATQNLSIGNEAMAFDARFGGISRRLEVPVRVILGIYARESGQGMIFSSESAEAHDGAREQPDSAGEKAPTHEGGQQRSGDKPGRSRPQLKIIK